jgi:membrane protein DedA with SNARE-associated domain
VEHLIVHAVEQYGYPAIFLLMLLESACVPFPSEVTMLFGGAFATPALGGDQHLNFVVVGLLGTFGNLAGSLLAYWVGRVGGRPLAERWGRLVFVREHELDRAEAWFADHGDAAVFVSRLLPVVRTFISLPAGIAEMPIRKFTVYTFLGCLPWTFALAGAGYGLGAQWTKVNRYFGPVSIVIAVALVAAAGWWMYRRRRSARADRESPVT